MAFGPTPQLDRKVVAWAGVNTDGSPCEGQIILQYAGPVMLDDSEPTPISVYPTRLVMPLIQRTLILDQGDGTTVTQVVGYAEAQVPASNDPDLSGSGGAYTVTENLSSRNGLTRTVVIDKDAQGVIWLNRLTSADVLAGEAPSYVSVATVNAIRRDVTLLSAEMTLLSGTVDAIAGGSYVTDEELDARLEQMYADLDDGPDLTLLYENAKA